MSKLWTKSLNHLNQEVYEPVSSLQKRLHVADSTPEAYAELFNKLYDQEKYSVVDPQRNYTILTYERLQDTGVELPPGYYIYESDNHGNEFLVKKDTRKDTFIEPDGVFQDILRDIESFLSKKNIYDKLGILYKRGILLYGPPGSGKTSILRKIINEHLPEDSVIVSFDKIPSGGFIDTIRFSLKERLKFFIFEELLSIIDTNRSTQMFLTFLDGEESLNNLMVVATTNYPEKIPGNLIDRPSRFDKLYKVDELSDEVRKNILEHFLQREVTEKELKLTKSMSTAALKEIGLLTLTQELTIEQAVKQLEKHKDTVKKSFNDRSMKVGFGE